jgi:hypothetical protein
MAEKRQLDLHLLRFLPHPLRDDFVTVGFLLVESDAGFAEVRLTRDWRMLQCVAPGVDLEWFAAVENEIRSHLTSFRSREQLLEMVNQKFGTIIDIAPTKAVRTDDPLQEMEALTSIYLVPLERGGLGQQYTSRDAIVRAMSESFNNAGVLALMQRNVDVARYTGIGDPFRMDFTYRVGNFVRMFHAVSVTANVEKALALAYRYSRLDEGMRKEELFPSLTVVLDQVVALRNERASFAVGMLEESSVVVKAVDEMPEVAADVRRELIV